MVLSLIVFPALLVNRIRPLTVKNVKIALIGASLLFAILKALRIAVPGFGGYQYAIHFTDSYSRFSAVYMMKQKSDVHIALDRFISKYCEPYGIVIKKMQCV